MANGPASVERDWSAAPTNGAGATSGASASGSDDRPVILYDGVCGLCDRYVQFVLARDRQRRFRFAPLQGPFAAKVLSRHGLRGADAPDSMMLVEGPMSTHERVRLRSDAVLAVVGALGGAWRLTRVLRLIPRFVRDVVYAVVARVRYRLFGRLDRCALPPAGARDRFLD